MASVRALILLFGIGCAIAGQCAAIDDDFDGIPDIEDNCLGVPNARQRDTDRDGLGNRCDFDLNNDCRVAYDDLAVIRRAYFVPGAPGSQHADFNGDRQVGLDDLARALRALGRPLATSGSANVCTCRPPETRSATPNRDFGGRDLYLLGAFTGSFPGDFDRRTFSDQGTGRYVSRVFVDRGGRFEYRIGDPSLTLELCGADEVRPYVDASLTGQACDGTTGSVQLPAAGCYEFGLQAPETGSTAEGVRLRVVERLGSRDIEVDESGGRYRFANGIELDIPPGAVSSPVSLNIAALPCAAADAIFGATALRSVDHRCLGGIVGEPDGFTFDRPVTVVLPVGRLQGGEIPVLATSSAGSSGYSIVPGASTVDGESRTLTAEITHFSSVSGAAVEPVGPEVTSTGTLPPCCSDRRLAGPEGCCCDTMRIQVAEGDASGSGCDCQLVGQDIEVEFLACPGRPLQRVSEFHSTDNCPTDFTASVEPSELTLWTCEDRRLEFVLAGTNEDGSGCRLAMPSRPVVGGDSGVVELVDIGADAYRVTGRREGTVEIRFASLVLRETSVSVRADVVPLESRWRVSEAGSQTCRVLGQTYREDDSGAGPVKTRVKDCRRIIVSTPSFPGDTVMAGPLTKTGNPSKPFTFRLTPDDPDRTVDCVTFMQSNGRQIEFGDPFCPGGGCQALSCTEDIDVEGRIGPASKGRIRTDSRWDFRARWLQQIEDQIVTVGADCTGDSDARLDRR